MTQPVQPELSIAEAAADGAKLCAALSERILGKPELVRMTVAAFFASGHVLLEGLPGLGKTTLAKSLAAATGLDYKRIQFTPDLMPADITGTHVLEEGPSGKRMRFVAGPVFTHFLLADEINRASPKTQAALLEAMGEGTVTLLGESRTLAAPFFVIATQNPIELEGTNPLPEAQLDRFAIKVDVPATDEQSLLRMLSERTDGTLPAPPPLLDHARALACQRTVDRVFLPEAVAVLIARLVARAGAGSDAPEAVRSAVRFGPSPRGAIWLARIARALALLDGRSGVGFEDVEEAVPHVLGHRIVLSYAARLDGVRPAELARSLLRETERELLSGNGPSKAARA